jgi:hypothetical protein
VFANVAFPLREFGIRDEDMLRDLVLLKLAMVELGLSGPAHAGRAVGRDGQAGGAGAGAGPGARAAAARRTHRGLDPDRSAGFVRLIRGLHQALGLTVILVTHDLDTWRRWPPAWPCCPKGVLAFGPLDEIMRVQDPFIERFFHSERSQAALARGRGLMESRSHAIAAGLFAIILGAGVVLALWWFSDKREATRGAGAGDLQQRQWPQPPGHRALPGHRGRQGTGIGLDPGNPRDVLVTVRIRADLRSPRAPAPGWQPRAWPSRPRRQR